MARPKKYTDDEVNNALHNVPDWNLDGNKLIREIAASNFAAAVGIINSIAVLAEAADHHPDILLYGWNKIRVTLSTHDQGGLTELDFMLAKKIDELNF